MKKLVIVISLLLLGAAAFVSKSWKEFIPDPYAVPDREPIRAWKLPDRAMKAVCMLGPPVLVSLTDKHLETRVVVFPGPIIRLPDDESTIQPYIEYFVARPLNPHGDASNLINSLDHYLENAVPEEIADYEIPKLVGGVPSRLEELRGMLGEPDVFIERSNPDRNRHIWEKPLCFEDTLVQELWVEEVDGRIIDAGASKDKEPARKL